MPRAFSNPLLPRIRSVEIPIYFHLIYLRRCNVFLTTVQPVCVCVDDPFLVVHHPVEDYAHALTPIRPVVVYDVNDLREK